MPPQEEIIRRLKSVHLFSGLSRPRLRMLAGLVEEIEQAAGLTLCRQGEPGERYFIVEEGELRVTRIDPEGRELEARRLKAGDAFGETSLLLRDVRDATAEVVQSARLLSIKKQDFDRLLKAEPRIEQDLRMRPEVAERRRYPRFSWLEERELPIKVLHKHPVILTTNLLMPSLGSFFLLLTSILAAYHWRVLALGWAGFVLSLAPLGFCLYLYNDWRNDVYVLTNRRVIHRERIGLVREQFSAAPLHAIQDVQQIQSGLAAHYWKFGDVIIDTAGGAGQVIFRSIPHPEQVQNAIFEQRGRAWAGARAQQRATIVRVMHRHFRKEVEEPPSAPEQQPRRRGSPRLFASLRAFLPATWHQEGSTVIWRKHWVALAQVVGLPVLIFVLTTAAVAAAALLQEELTPEMVVLYGLAVFILAPWFLWQFDDWQNDLYQVTATRVIHIERLPFYLREERREASLEQITNVRFDQSFWGRLFKYGDVIVETAALAGTFNFRMVSRPQDVQAEIFAHIEADRRRRQEQEAKQHQAELLDWFSIYDDIRRTTARPSKTEEAK